MLLLIKNKLILYFQSTLIKKTVMVMDLRVLSTVVKMTNFMTHFHRVTTEFHQNQECLFYFFSFGKLSIKFQTMGS